MSIPIIGFVIRLEGPCIKVFINRPRGHGDRRSSTVIVGGHALGLRRLSPQKSSPNIFIQATYVGATRRPIEQAVAHHMREDERRGNMNYMYTPDAKNGLMAHGT